MELVQTLSRVMLDRDPTPTEIKAFENLPPEDVTARIERLTELLSELNGAKQKEMALLQIGNKVEFSKKWLLKLKSGPAPDKTVEYQDRALIVIGNHDVV
jgi:hypothetical protein